MTTKIRTIKTHLVESIDSIYKAIKENGGKNIVKWLVKYTGTSSDAETEVEAPNAAFDGSVEEVTTVEFTNTKINSIGSEYLSIPFSAAAGGGSETMHYFYVDKAEITTVTCLAKVACTESSSLHFFVDDGAGGETEYYIWINKGAGADPTESGTAIECDISLSTTAIEVAEVIDGLIDLKANVGCDNGGTADLPIINTNNGDVTNASEGTVPTGFTISIEEGGDDPAATGTGHSCDISGATSAADVGTIFVAAITAVAGLTSTGTTTALIESDNTGSITDVVQSDSSLGTITKINEGSNSYEGGYLYIVSASADDTDAANKDTREVTITGWDYNGNVVDVIVAMNGTTAVKLGTRLKAVSHMYGSKFGSAGQDAKADITLQTSNTANATVLLTISATFTESVGARIYVPDGSKMVIVGMTLFQTSNTNTGVTMVKAYMTGFESSLNTDPDYDYLTIIAKAYARGEGICACELSFEVRTGTDTAVITLKEREVAAEGNESFEFALAVYTFE